MNLLRLRERTKRKTRLPVAVISNTSIVEDLNEGYRYLSALIANENEDYFEEQKSKFDLVANSGLYSLPTDTLKFKQLRLAYTTPTAETDYVIATEYDPNTVHTISVDEQGTTSNPIVDITNNFYRIFPKPTTASTNGGELYYIALPSALVNTGDSPVIPTQWHDLISDYAAIQECEDHGLMDRATKLENRFESKVQQMLKDIEPRSINRPERMRNPLELGRSNPTELW